MSEQEKEFQILEEPVTIEVDEVVSMQISDGIIVFQDKTTGDTVAMNEEDFSDADIAYLMLRLEQRFPSMKSDFAKTEEEG